MDKLNNNFTKKFTVEEAKELAFLCVKTQIELKEYLSYKLQEYYPFEKLFAGKGYLYARGELPVALVAHMDTTDHVTVKRIAPVTGKVTELVSTSEARKRVEHINETIDKDGNHIYESPQGIGGDDRCGVYTILRMLEKGYRPWVLFTEDEEKGCIGATKFCKTKGIQLFEDLKFLVQIDRRNGNDAVFYEDANEEFHEWVETVTNYKEAIGSYTDICELSDVCRVSSVNLSCGYRNEHTVYETVCIEELLRTVDAVEKLLIASEDVEQFKYKKYNYGSYGKYYSSYYNSKYSFWDEDELEYIFLYNNKGKYKYSYGYGQTEAECIGDFLVNHSKICWDDVFDYGNKDEIDSHDLVRIMELDGEPIDDGFYEEEDDDGLGEDYFENDIIKAM